jgi:hypothetical protein
MQDPASELRRIPLPRTWVNKGKKTKGRGSISAHRPLFSYQPTSPKTQDTKASECCLSSYYSEPQAALG